MFIFLKGSSKVMAYYSGSVPRALLDLFPNIGLEKNKFENKRKFMMELALILINLFLI